MKNWRNAEEASQRPWGPVMVENRPMTKDPLTFTSNVPQGNVCPTVLAIQPENHQRPRLPRPPPINIQSAFHIIPNTCTRDIPEGFDSSARQWVQLNRVGSKMTVEMGSRNKKDPRRWSGTCCFDPAEKRDTRAKNCPSFLCSRRTVAGPIPLRRASQSSRR